MNCPTCTAPLAAFTYEGVTIHSCPGCEGEFVGPEQIHAIINTRLTQFTPEVQAAAAARAPVFGVPALESRHLHCPQCQGQMQTLNFAVDSGIYLDRCHACSGLWLDASELERLQAVLELWEDRAPGQIALLAGTLASTRQANHDRQRSAFQGSRFALVNALMNRVLSAAA